jgi:hypothetical protein
VTKQDIEEHFSTHGTGKITEIKLMNGFGFIEYEDAMDARDIVPGKRLGLQLESQIANLSISLPYVRSLAGTQGPFLLTRTQTEVISKASASPCNLPGDPGARKIFQFPRTVQISLVRAVLFSV